MRVLPVVVSTLAVLTMGCGVPTDSQPRAIPDERVPFSLLDLDSSTTTVVQPATPTTVTVYMVAGDRLTPVSRQVAGPASPALALGALLAGSTAEEAARNVRTALPTTTGVSATSVTGSLARVDLAVAFVATGTIEQVLAVAQIVYTVTALDAIDAVAFTLAGRPVEVPVGDGTLKDGALSRSDFAAVASP